MSIFSGGGGDEPGERDHKLGAVYYAIVTQNDDTEGSARVKVRYPWLDSGDIDQSHWAPICVPMIGDEFGMYTVPEVNDTVMVVFVGGDIRHPVVMGGAWSKSDPPPEVNEDGKNDFRLIKSRSGHRLLFDDSSSAKVLLTDCKDKRLLSVGNHAEGGASAQNKYGVGSPPDLSGDAGKGISLADLEGTINFICPAGEFKISADTVDIHAKDGVDIKAGGVMSISGKSKASFKSGSGGKYEGLPLLIN